MSHVLPLNPAQRAGVEYRGGPLLLLAGAGTGKTRVITHRVAALIAEGVPAWRILGVTFTNKAAQEMRERIGGLLELGPDELRRDGPWIGTFHSICARILRRHGEPVGLSRNFAIYDMDDQKSLMRKILKQLDVDPAKVSPSAVLGKIDSAKNLGLGRAQLEQLRIDEPLLSWTRQAWSLYEDQLRSADAADFGDLLTLTVDLLNRASNQVIRPTPEDGPRRTVKLATGQAPSQASGQTSAGSSAVDPVVGLRRRFFHIVVDEYQDTNPVQAQLIDRLCSEHTQLCVVGDDDQAIYGWRGADVKQILGFPDRHPGCEVIRLEQNYRSTTLILDCANAVIRAGVHRHDKQLWSELGPGNPVELYGFTDEREEARYVARTMVRAIGEGESPSQIAVFYRTHAQSRPLEEALRQHGVRYRMLGGIRFYDRREIKDLVSYLRLLTNPNSDLDCLRIINVPARRIGSKTIESLANWAVQHQTSLYAACGPLSKHGADAGLGKTALRAVQGFWEVVEQLRIDADKLSHDQIAALVLDRIGYVESLEAELDGDTRVENLNEFVGSLEQFATEQPEAGLAEYLEQISLATTEDDTSVDDAITVMTVHSAKGLEFDRVFLIGLEEQVFPHARVLADEDREGIEEERRLAYVALTRARRKLQLSYVQSRFLWGRSMQNEPSRFVAMLPEQAIVRFGHATRKPARRPEPRPLRRDRSWDNIEREPDEAPVRPPPTQQRAAASKQSDRDDIEYDEEQTEGVRVVKGMRVRHPKWGVGQVLAWSGSGSELKLTLSFAGEQRTVLARYCTLG
jgi:DNA helicase II / ATP-dependent DNA helicase PcrA